MITQKQHEKLLRDCTLMASRYGIKDIEDIRDILQNCYLSSLDKTVVNFVPYIFISFKNRCIDYHKHRKSSNYKEKVKLDYTMTEDLEVNESLEIASLILDCLDMDFYFHIPIVYKNMFKDYFLNNKSYANIAKENKMNLSRTIETITNLTNYSCLLTIGTFYIKQFKLVNNKKTYKIMQHTLRKTEYLKYTECITSAHFGYHFNFELFREACREMLFIELAPMDKHNREKLKQAALKLFTELYRVDEVKQTVIEEPVKIDSDEIKDTITTKKKLQRVSGKSNKKSL